MKKGFRSVIGADDRARYPVFGDERGRRRFLRELGLLTLGGGVLATSAAGCSHSTGGIPDHGPAPLDLAQDAMDAGPDTGAVRPDLPHGDTAAPDRSKSDTAESDRRR
jgi:hypothetical protein